MTHANPGHAARAAWAQVVRWLPQSAGLLHQPGGCGEHHAQGGGGWHSAVIGTVHSRLESHCTCPTLHAASTAYTSQRPARLPIKFTGQSTIFMPLRWPAFANDSTLPRSWHEHTNHGRRSQVRSAATPASILRKPVRAGAQWHGVRCPCAVTRVHCRTLLCLCASATSFRHDGDDEPSGMEVRRAITFAAGVHPKPPPARPLSVRLPSAVSLLPPSARGQRHGPIMPLLSHDSLSSSTMPMRPPAAKPLTGRARRGPSPYAWRPDIPLAQTLRQLTIAAEAQGQCVQPSQPHPPQIDAPSAALATARARRFATGAATTLSTFAGSPPGTPALGSPSRVETAAGLPSLRPARMGADACGTLPGAPRPSPPRTYISEQSPSWRVAGNLPDASQLKSFDAHDVLLESGVALQQNANQVRRTACRWSVACGGTDDADAAAAAARSPPPAGRQPPIAAQAARDTVEEQL